MSFASISGFTVVSAVVFAADDRRHPMVRAESIPSALPRHRSRGEPAAKGLLGVDDADLPAAATS